MSGWQPSGYTPVRPLGAGASGTVVLATHDPTGTPVAIKFLVDDLGDDASFRAAFRDEARLLGEIDDPHVCRLYEYIESADGAAIVMELVNGVSLRQMLREHGPTTPESALVVLKGSLAGL
jgi:serine/threonine protein kinase